MNRVVAVKAKSNYVLALRFDDGLEGELCVRDRLHGPVFHPLNNTDLFNQVMVDPYGAICWPNKADMAPDGLYQDVLSKG